MKDPAASFRYRLFSALARLDERRPWQVLAAALRNRGAIVTSIDNVLEVRGLDAKAIGEIALDHRIVLHELSPQRDSLEDAYFRLTEDSVEYHAADFAMAQEAS